MIRIVRNLLGARGLLAAIAVLSLVPAGCQKSQTSQQALDAQLAAANLQKESTAPFAGTVTVDGQPPAPARGQSLIVMLYDQKDPEKNKPPLTAVCRKDGRFEFYTYAAGDGVRQGSYVVLFAQLMGKRGVGMVQPDGLLNLYDDPDKNAQNKDFVVEVASPGKTNYVFNLEIAGKQPATPGPHAVTEIRKK